MARNGFSLAQVSGSFCRRRTFSIFLMGQERILFGKLSAMLPLSLSLSRYVVRAHVFITISLGCSCKSCSPMENYNSDRMCKWTNEQTKWFGLISQKADGDKKKETKKTQTKEKKFAWNVRRWHPLFSFSTRRFLICHWAILKRHTAQMRPENEAGSKGRTKTRAKKKWFWGNEKRQ